MGRRIRPLWRFVLGCLVWGAGLPSVAQDQPRVEIRRTTGDVAHVRADDWYGLGLGAGYAQAEDALCTLADGYLTYAGERSLHFGPDGRRAQGRYATESNLDLDVFFRAVAGPVQVRAFEQDQPPALRQLVQGYAAGYNRYLASQPAGQSCAGQPWVHPIAPQDVYRRMIAASLAGGYARFAKAIAIAAPPGVATPGTAPSSSAQRPAGTQNLAALLQSELGVAGGLGSNGMAWGADATGQEQGVLFGNPHWFWGGPDRFHQIHLTLPGQLDVAGVAMLGAPVVMIGFNHDIAWTHTVSAARRYTFTSLELDPADPTRYRVDGRSLPMRAHRITVPVRHADGSVGTVSRTLYDSRFGLLLRLDNDGAALGWSRQRAWAIQDVNASSHGAFANFLQWGAARSLDAFVDIQRRMAAMPWVNTVAIGRNDGRVWYADVGAMPNVPDTLRARCASPMAAALASVDPYVPVLDGSRSECGWMRDPRAAVAGAMPAAAMPQLLARDYVANMNDSHWLPNPAHRLEGFAANLGGERQPLRLRARQGLAIAQALATPPARSAAALAERAGAALLDAHSYTAQHFRAGVLDQACDPAAPPAASEASDIGAACRILRTWSGAADAQARGALLWEAYWQRLSRVPARRLYARPFSAEDPLHTPGAPTLPRDELRRLLAQALDDLRARAIAPDDPLGAHRYVQLGGQTVPLFGGCEDSGYFTIACPARGAQAMSAAAYGNSYLQLVYFDAQGVHARTMLAHGQQDSALAGGPGGDSVRRHAQRTWLDFPYADADIARDPALRTRWLYYSE
ncbi:beta-lactam antibiotic acylase [Bordetella ansorpii]|uniref:Beta-lactam antibiotic acylase n=1 Tax=Bordetella ansorpii TaxID=288768 RepID=A0A157LR36_9BORD|nr:penicillin acylase family protein [Bordetella ansorpii]SAH99273.1 beta-lactam antibiotic acylase [Bordetella ansorpii]